MSRILSAAIGVGFTLALAASVTGAVDSAGVAPNDYQLLKANCSIAAATGRAQCVKDAKAKDNSTVVSAKIKDALWRCEDLTSREERQCIVRELEGQHPDTSRPSQGTNNGAADTPAPPPR